MTASKTSSKPNRSASDLSSAQKKLLATLYPNHTNAELAAQFDLPLYSVKNLARRLGLRKTSDHMQTAAKRGQFEKGHTSWNKGKSYPCHPNTARHHFKEGHRPHNWLPVGASRIRDGYIETKVTDTGSTLRDFKPMHHIIWIEAFGAIPHDHCIVFRDANRQNLSLDNLECISRQDLMKRNSIYNYPPSVVESIRIVAGFNRKLRRVSHVRNSQ